MCCTIYNHSPTEGHWSCFQFGSLRIKLHVLKKKNMNSVPRQCVEIIMYENTVILSVCTYYKTAKGSKRYPEKMSVFFPDL